jgi:hypothetical protein
MSIQVCPLLPFRLSLTSRHPNHETLRLELINRFVSRVIPISATTTATIKNLQSVSIPIIKSGFETPENVEALGAGHSVDLSNPDRTIIIEVNKVCHFHSLGSVTDRRTLWEYQYYKITIL